MAEGISALKEGDEVVLRTSGWGYVRLLIVRVTPARRVIVRWHGTDYQFSRQTGKRVGPGSQGSDMMLLAPTPNLLDLADRMEVAGRISALLTGLHSGDWRKKSLESLRRVLGALKKLEDAQ